MLENYAKYSDWEKTERREDLKTRSKFKDE